MLKLSLYNLIHQFLVNDPENMDQKLQVFLSYNRARKVLQKSGYTQRDYIKSADLKQVLEKLSGEEFENDIFEQIWEQCKLNSQSLCKVGNFIQNIVRAQAILIHKTNETIKQMQKLELEIQSNTSNLEKNSLREQQNQFSQLKQSFLFDLSVIRKPFSGTLQQESNIIQQIKEPNTPKITNDNNFVEENELSRYSPIKSRKDNFVWIFYFTVLGFCSQFMVFFYVNAYMNTMIFICILSLFLFQYFSSRFIRVLFWCILLSLIIDVIWYIVEAKNLWNKRSVSNWPDYLNGYLKFLVILQTCVFFIKFMIGVLLCSQYNINEKEKIEVYACGSAFIITSQEQKSPMIFGQTSKSEENSKKKEIKDQL